MAARDAGEHRLFGGRASTAAIVSDEAFAGEPVHAQTRRAAPQFEENALNWTVLWQIAGRPATDVWNRAVAETEAGALDRAKHFIALGYPVRAITDRSGALYMDEAQIAARFGEPATEGDAMLPR
jgi:hypothetical protein